MAVVETDRAFHVKSQEMGSNVESQPSSVSLYPSLKIHEPRFRELVAALDEVNTALETLNNKPGIPQLARTLDGKTQETIRKMHLDAADKQTARLLNRKHGILKELLGISIVFQDHTPAGNDLSGFNKGAVGPSGKDLAMGRMKSAGQEHMRRTVGTVGITQEAVAAAFIGLASMATMQVAEFQQVGINLKDGKAQELHQDQPAGGNRVELIATLSAPGETENSGDNLAIGEHNLVRVNSGLMFRMDVSSIRDDVRAAVESANLPDFDFPDSPGILFDGQAVSWGQILIDVNIGTIPSGDVHLGEVPVIIRDIISVTDGRVLIVDIPSADGVHFIRQVIFAGTQPNGGHPFSSLQTFTSGDASLRARTDVSVTGPNAIFDSLAGKKGQVAVLRFDLTVAGNSTPQPFFNALLDNETVPPNTPLIYLPSADGIAVPRS